MFWIPQGWAPYYAEWLLSFPRAPLGSVSVNMWVMASAAVIVLAHDALSALVALLGRTGTKQTKEKTRQPMKVPAEKHGEGDRKKDL